MCRENVYIALKKEKVTVFSDQTFDEPKQGCQASGCPGQKPCSALYEGEATVASHAKKFGRIIAVDEGCMAGGFTVPVNGKFIDVSGASPSLPQTGTATASDNEPYQSLGEVEAFYDHKKRIKGDQLKSAGWQRFRKFIQLNNQAALTQKKPWRKLQAHWQYHGKSLKALGEARDLGIVLRWSGVLVFPFMRGWLLGKVTEWWTGLGPTDDKASLLNDTKSTGINEFNHRWLYVAEGKTAEDPATYDDAEFGLHLKQMGTADGKWKPRMSEEGPGGPTWSMLSVNNACERWGDKKGRTHGNMLYDAIQKLHNRSG